MRTTLRAAWAIFQRELLQERRTRFTVHSVLAFTGSALLVILFAVRAQTLDPTPRSGVIWIVLLFSGLSAAARGFLQEKDQGTLALLRIHTEPLAVFLGKWFYGAVFLAGLLAATLALYAVVMGMGIPSPLSFAVSVLAGAVGLSGVTTLTSAMMVQTDRRGSLFQVLSVPLLVPLILLLTRVTRDALVDGNPSAVLSDYAALGGFCGVVLTLGVLLFGNVFREEG